MTYPDGEKHVGKFKDDNFWNVTVYDKDGKIIENWLKGVRQDVEAFSEASPKLLLEPMEKSRDKELKQSILSDIRQLLDTNKCQGCLLKFANLKGADLKGAELQATIHYSDLTDANLTDANLSRSSLKHTNLSGANLTNAVLDKANLTDANLSGANLTNAILNRTNLSGANLEGAIMEGVIFDEKRNEWGKRPTN